MRAYRHMQVRRMSAADKTVAGSGVLVVMGGRLRRHFRLDVNTKGMVCAPDSL